MFDNDHMPEVMRMLGSWYTCDRHDGAGRGNPFSQWYPTENPVADLTWIAFGFDFETKAYSDDPKLFYILFPKRRRCRPTSRSNCPCMACAGTDNARRLLHNMQDFEVPGNHAKLFTVARACLAVLVDGLLPAGPVIAHHWMIGGRFTMDRRRTRSIPD